MPTKFELMESQNNCALEDRIAVIKLIIGEQNIKKIDINCQWIVDKNDNVLDCSRPRYLKTIHDLLEDLRSKK